MHDLVRERLVISLACVAHMEAAFEWTREYVHDRKGNIYYCHFINLSLI